MYQVFIGMDNKRYAIPGFIPNAKKYPLHMIRFSDGHYIKAPKTFIRQILNEKLIENGPDS